MMRELAGIFFIGLLAALFYAFGVEFVSVLGTQTYGRSDELSFIWLLHRMGENLTTFQRPLFDGQILFPNSESIALSEPVMLTSLIYRALYLFGHNPLLAFNLTVLVLLALNLSTMYLFCRNFTGRFAALMGAALFTFSMVRLSRLGQVHLMAQFPLPLIVHSLWRFEKTGEKKHLYFAAIWFAIQFYFSLSLGMIALVGLLLYLPIRYFLAPRSVNLLELLKPLSLSILILAPLAITFFGVRAKYGTVRTMDEARWNSAYITHYLLVPEDHPYAPIMANRNLFQRALSLTHEKILFIGFAGLFFLFLGIRETKNWNSGPERFLKWWVLATIIFVIWFSFGPQARLYELFYYTLPGMKGIRTPARFGLVYLFLASFLVSVGVQRLLGEAPRWKRYALVVALFIFGIWENQVSRKFWPPSVYLAPVHQYLAQTEDRDPVIFLPFETNASERTYGNVTHGHPIANGYYGFTPPSYQRLKQISEAVASPQTIAEYVATGFRYLVLQAGEMGEDDYQTWLSCVKQLGLKFQLITERFAIVDLRRTVSTP